MAYYLTELAGATAIVFARTCDGARKLALLLRNLGFDALPIHGQMSQPKRLGALNKFKAGERSILVATGAVQPRQHQLVLALCGRLTGARAQSQAPVEAALLEYYDQVLFGRACLGRLAVACKHATFSHLRIKNKQPMHMRDTGVLKEASLCPTQTWPAAGWTSRAWTWWSTTTCPTTPRSTCTAWAAPLARGALAARSRWSRSARPRAAGSRQGLSLVRCCAQLS